MQQFQKMIETARAGQQVRQPVLAGNSIAAHALRQMVTLAAASFDPVQMAGPEGSGFAEAARAIHVQSDFADELFVDAGTGTLRDDHFCIRWTGTLYVGDVGRMSAHTQNALLEWMESSDGRGVRIISTASNLALTENRILTALQSALAHFTIDFPPLTERTEDIPIMLQRLWAESTHPLPPIFARSAWAQLLSYEWEGGFDELMSFADKASRLYGGREIGDDQVRKLLGQNVARELERPDFSLKDHMAQEEKMFLIEALLKCNGVVQDAATLSGVNRTTFLAKLKRHGLARA